MVVNPNPIPDHLGRGLNLVPAYQPPNPNPIPPLMGEGLGRGCRGMWEQE